MYQEFLNFLLHEDNELISINNFNWYYKDLFDWEDYFYSQNKRIVYFGKKKDNSKYQVIVKKIKINNNYEHILKEIYFLVCCKNNSNFTQIVDMFLSDNNNYIFIILKYEGVSLQNLLNCQDFEYWKIKGFIKHVIFQIISGLNILHKVKLIHNDIKPSNILITGDGQTKICDFGSLDIAGDTRLSTIYYCSPDSLLQKTTDQKDDMWSVGVIMLGLYKRNQTFFKSNNPYYDSLSRNEKKVQQLKDVLSKFEITVDNNRKIDIKNYNDFNRIIQIIQSNSYDQNNFKSELKSACLADIDDPDAIEFLYNLLEINPKKRFTAEQALKSNYFLNVLVNNENDIKKNEINYNEKDYNLLLNNVNDGFIFLNNIKLIKQKFLGQVLFE